MTNAKYITNISVLEELSLDESGISDGAIQIFSWITYIVVCQTINVFGIMTNIINIICFAKQGFQDSVNISFVALSVSDLCGLITLSWSNIGFTPAFETTDLEFEPSEVIFLVGLTPHFSFSRLTGWITALITLERCLCVVAPLKIKGIFTPKRTAIITVCISTIIVLGAAPTYAVNKLGMKFSQQRNKTIFGLIFTDNRDYVQTITYIISNFVTPLTAFLVIGISTMILAVKLHSTKHWMQKSTTCAQAIRVSSRNQKVAKMVVMVSVLFIACFIPTCVTMLVVAFEPAISYRGKYMKVGILLGGLIFPVESMNASMNIFIYYHMSRKYRDIFTRIFLRISILCGFERCG